LVKWHEQYGPNGLVVIEIDDGKTDTTQQVEEWTNREKIPYPVYYDKDGTMVGQYGVRGFPSMYLVGRDGKVAWEGHGWGGEEGVAEIEQAIRTALAASK
jgi:peroxiredoxin